MTEQEAYGQAYLNGKEDGYAAGYLRGAAESSGETDGIRVYMKTGEPATQYFGSNFADYDTSYEDFCRKWNFKNQTKEEFEKLRFEVDVEMTKRMNIYNDEQMKIWDSIKGLIH